MPSILTAILPHICNLTFDTIRFSLDDQILRVFTLGMGINEKAILISNDEI